MKVRVSNRCKTCGLYCGNQPYCGHHRAQCSHPNCETRVRRASTFCAVHRTIPVKFCEYEGCHYTVKADGPYCGNHTFACVTEGCSGRTKVVGKCKACRTKSSDRGTHVSDPRGKGPRSELREMIARYESVQHEANERGKIARERLPKLRLELGMLSHHTPIPSPSPVNGGRGPDSGARSRKEILQR